jgi:hypothetical protein
MRRLSVAAALVASVLALMHGQARADVITTYTLSDVATDTGATITGSFEIDQTTYNDHFARLRRRNIDGHRWSYSRYGRYVFFRRI